MADLAAITALSAGSKIDMAFVVTMTAYWYFVLYGGDGTDGSYGLVSQLMSLISKYFLFPISVMWLTSRSAAVLRPASPWSEADRSLS